MGDILVGGYSGRWLLWQELICTEVILVSGYSGRWLFWSWLCWRVAIMVGAIVVGADVGR